MIRISRIKDLDELVRMSKEVKTEVENYLKDITENVTGKRELDNLDLEEVGEILIIEDTDTIKDLEEIGIVEYLEGKPQILAEFADEIKIGDRDYLRIVCVCSNSFGYSIYYPKGVFGREFEESLEEYIDNKRNLEEKERKVN